MAGLGDVEAATFREAATRFCAHITERDRMTTTRFLTVLPGHLAALYAAAAALPEVAPDVESPERDRNELAEWRPLFEALGAKIGPHRYYSETSDPSKPDAQETVTGDLADDLADIYGDLRTGLAFEVAAGREAPNDVLWTWRFDFESHWGRHATSALRAVHTLLYDRIEVNLEPDAPAVSRGAEAAEATVLSVPPGGGTL